MNQERKQHHIYIQRELKHVLRGQNTTNTTMFALVLLLPYS